MIREQGGNQWTEHDVRRMIANPFYCITISPTMCVEHEPLITKEKWMAAARRMIRTDGADVFLRNLLANLEGDYVTGSGLPEPGPDSPPSP